MPECNTSANWYLLQLIEHHLADLVNRSNKISENEIEYLPFSSRLIIGVEIANFDMAK